MRKKCFLILPLILLLITSCSNNDSGPSFDNYIEIEDNVLELKSASSLFYGRGIGDANTYNTDLTIFTEDLDVVFNLGAADDVDFEFAFFYIEAFSPENEDDILSEGTYIADPSDSSSGIFNFSVAEIGYIDGRSGEIIFHIVTDGRMVIENSERTFDGMISYDLQFSGVSTEGVEISLRYDGEFYEDSLNFAKGTKNIKQRIIK